LAAGNTPSYFLGRPALPPSHFVLDCEMREIPDFLPLMKPTISFIKAMQVSPTRVREQSV
jgi:hypothetical protein